MQPITSPSLAPAPGTLTFICPVQVCPRARPQRSLPEWFIFRAVLPPVLPALPFLPRPPSLLAFTPSPPPPVMAAAQISSPTPAHSRLGSMAKPPSRLNLSLHFRCC